MTISAVIITRNEEESIGRCLAAIGDLVEETVIVDSGSTDRTRAVAESYPNVKFIAARWEGYGANKNRGNAAAGGDYILSLDADEEVSTELRAAILAARPHLDGTVAFAVNRIARYGRRWIRHSGWYPDWQLRLFPRAGSRWDSALVHEKVVLGPGVRRERLPGHLLHHAYATVSDHIAKVNAYSSLRARELAGGRWLLLRGILKAKLRFLKHYIAGRGFLDGGAGFLIAVISAFAIFAAYAKARELGDGE
jgi:(heptosyl)LPS beta-1,4-glucosyltransferase